MVTDQIETDFRDKVCEQIQLVPEGINRYRVFSPFLFEDGDHLAIVLKRIGDKWRLSDEGHTYMHLTYDIDEKDLQRGTRQRIISNTLSTFFVKDSDGELLIDITDSRYGDSLYSFIQAIIRISDISYLSRERVRSTFIEDFRSFLASKVEEPHRFFDWHDLIKDPVGNYTVDCRINERSTPLFIYAISGDDKARDATINLLQFERWNVSNHSIAIFENQEEISRKVLARLSDVFEKQFSSLELNKDRISKYLETELANK
jgi:hypothetical protein